MKSFAPLSRALGECFPARNAILDGEIVCLGADGRALDKPLYRRAEPVVRTKLAPLLGPFVRRDRRALPPPQAASSWLFKIL